VNGEALAMLATGSSAREIATELDIPYPKVLKLKREFEQAQLDGTIAKATEVDEVELVTLADELKEQLPMSGELIEQGLEGYQTLDLKMQQAAGGLVDRITDMANRHGLEVAEFKMLTESLCRIQEAFFNKNVTNVNVLNQTVSDKSVTSFKSLQRV